jgi:hypothetical protein
MRGVIQTLGKRGPKPIDRTLHHRGAPLLNGLSFFNHPLGVGGDDRRFWSYAELFERYQHTDDADFQSAFAHRIKEKLDLLDELAAKYDERGRVISPLASIESQLASIENRVGEVVTQLEFLLDQLQRIETELGLLAKPNTRMATGRSKLEVSSARASESRFVFDYFPRDG